MPRPPRLVVPGVPLHITQRGVDRCATFLADDDFALYLWLLREASAEVHCPVHAYVLMTNHVHLLLTPADALGPARLMQSLGRRYVRYFNDRYQRTGTLWEGRYRSALVDSTRYFFACSRYIESNPLRAGLVDDPAAYAWSSYRHNACGADDRLISPHPEYTALGTQRDARFSAYRALFEAELAPSAMAAVRTAPLARLVLPTTSYQEAVAAVHGLPLEAGTRAVADASFGGRTLPGIERPTPQLRPAAAAEGPG